MRPPRNEYKYLIDIKQKEVLLAFWSRYLIKDPYSDENGKTPILSMYYDSPTLDFYNEKLDGIKDRNKIRLRVYDYDYKDGIPAFLEIKQRFGDKVRKIRVFTKKYNPRLQALGEWKFENIVEEAYFTELIARYRPVPTAQVFYIRDAYQAIIEEDLRITFDCNLIGLHPEEKLSADLLMDKKRYLMPENYCILEIKNNNNELPKWVFEGVSKLGLVLRSIPKYITAVEVLKINEERLNTGEYL